MAFSFALSQATNDYSIKNGRIVLSSDSDATVDRVYTRLQTERAEWFLDVTKGVPYYGDDGILGGKKGLPEITAILRREILDVFEVDKINQLNTTREQRMLNVSGDIQINGEAQGIGLTI